MRKLLIVVDYQNDFVNGSLGFAGAELLEEPILNLIKQFKEENNDIVFTLDTHYENYLETMEGQKLPVPHCIKGTNGHELFGKVKEELSTCLGFEKNTFGCNELINYLRIRAYDEVVLCGLVSNICVISNAVIAKTVLPNARIVIYRNATGSNDLEMQEKAFDVLKNLHIDIL